MIKSHHAGYVVDASVAVKWFIFEGEPNRDTALNLRNRHIAGQTQLIIPELFLLEVPNAIKAGRKGTEEELYEVLQTLEDLDLQVERHSQPVLKKTNTIASTYKLTWYDAVYVALAEMSGFPCVTADEALLRKMKGHNTLVHLRDLAFPETN